MILDKNCEETINWNGLKEVNLNPASLFAF